MWYQQNKSRVNAKRRIYEKKNRSRIRMWKRNWVEKHREQHYQNVHRSYWKQRLSVIEALGGKCVRCGFNDPRALQVDHINGGGVKELRAIANKLKYNRMVIESVKNKKGKYQLLCANCNWIKKSENKEIPNKKF